MTDKAETPDSREIDDFVFDKYCDEMRKLPLPTKCIKNISSPVKKATMQQRVKQDQDVNDPVVIQVPKLKLKLSSDHIASAKFSTESEGGEKA